MNKKYIVFLVTIFLLVSCGNNQKATPEAKRTSEPPQQETSVEVENAVEESSVVEEADLLDPEAEGARVEALKSPITDTPEENPAIEVEVPEPTPEEISLTGKSDATIPEDTVEELAEEVEDEATPEPAPTTETPAETSVPAPEVEESEPQEPVAESKVIELTQTYRSPGGPETVIFTLDVSGDEIENVSVTTVEASNVGEKYIAGFSGAINSAVTGKTLQEAESISIVSGSSLTTGAFTKALKEL